MFEFLHQAWNFHIWAVAAAIAALVALTSILADRRRQRRKLLQNVGFMPWTGISIAAMMVALVSLAFAINAG